MTIKLKLLFDKFLPTMDELMGVQKQGICTLTQKVGYAISRTYNMAINHFMEYQKWNKTIMSQYMEMEPNGVPKLNSSEDGKHKKFIFLSKEKEAEYKTIVEEKLQEEVEFNCYKFSEEELDQCQNVPVETMIVLEMVGMVTEFTIAKAALTIHK
jgi:hypothetical protein